MSDIPSDPGSEEELASLGINFDSQAFSAQINAAQEQVEEFGTAAVQSLQTVTAASQALNESLNNGLKQDAEAAQGLNDQLTETAGHLREINDLNQLRAELGISGQAAGSYDEMRGGLFPDSSGGGGDDGSGGGGGGNVGSLFGAARGIRSGAGLLNMVDPGAGKGIMGGADLLYMTQGFRAIDEILPHLNDTIEATPGLLAPLVEGFAAMGVEMAGLAALAAPIIAVGVAIAGIILVLKAMQEQADLTSSGLERQVQNEGEKQRISNETSDAATQDINDYQQKIRNNNKQVADLQQTQRDIITQAFKDQGVTPTAEMVQGSLDSGGPGGAYQGKGYDDATKKIKELQDQTAQWGELVSGAFGDLTDSTHKAADAIQQHIAAADELANKEKIRQSLDGLTTQAADKKLLQLQDEQKTLEAQHDELAKINDTSKTTTDAIAANNKALADNAYAQQYLTGTVQEAARALDEQAAATKRVEDVAKALQKADDDRAKAEQDLATKTADAKEKELASEQQYTQGSLQDTQQRLDIAQKESRQETDIKLQSLQAANDLGTKLAENEGKAMQELDRQLSDDQTKLGETLEKDRRDAAATEQTNLEDHLQKLADIQNQQHNSDQQALLDRNFLQLAKNKEATGQSVAAEDERYNTQQQHLKESLVKQEQDQVIAEAQQEAQQRLAWQRKNQDLDTQYEQDLQKLHTQEERKILAQQTAEARALADLTTNENYRIQLLRLGMREELDLLQEQEQQRVDIINQSVNNIGAGTSGGSTGPGGGRIRQVPQFAGGGDFDSPFVMNEPGSSGFERVNIGSTSFGSNTAALVIPFGVGHVDANKGGGQPIQIYNTWQIQGSDPDQVVNLAINKMQDMLEGFTKR